VVVRPCTQAVASTVECTTAEGREERTLALSRWMSSSSLRFLRMFIRLLDSARRRAAAVVTASICQLALRVPQRKVASARDTRRDRSVKGCTYDVLESTFRNVVEAVQFLSPLLAHLVLAARDRHQGSPRQDLRLLHARTHARTRPKPAPRSIASAGIALSVRVCVSEYAPWRSWEGRGRST
jgi:hypothetical protein